MSILRTDEGELALAIHRRDFDAAIALLDLMAAQRHRWALAVQAARRAVNPPAALPDLTYSDLPIADAEPEGVDA